MYNGPVSAAGNALFSCTVQFQLRVHILNWNFGRFFNFLRALTVLARRRVGFLACKHYHLICSLQWFVLRDPLNPDELGNLC